MTFLFLPLLLLAAPVLAEEPVAKSSPVVTQETTGSSEYEIDYEEEPESEEVSEPEPEPVKSKKGERKKAAKNSGGPAVQGSRAKNRFAPILKSETKSLYKKDGKVLDVDAD